MTEPVKISIATAFSPVPAGRTAIDGKFNGEAFRKKFVAPRLRNGETVLLDLDGMESLPSSFWEEIFGGLVREGFEPDLIHDRILLETSDEELEPYEDMAWRFVREEVERQH